jgi:hypothetical protein
MDSDTRTGNPGSFPEEGRFTVICLDQLKSYAGCNCEDETGETRTGSEVDGARRKRSEMRDQVEAIQDVSCPERGAVGVGHEVDALVPA